MFIKVKQDGKPYLLNLDNVFSISTAFRRISSIDKTRVACGCNVLENSSGEFTLKCFPIDESLEEITMMIDGVQNTNTGINGMHEAILKLAKG